MSVLTEPKIDCHCHVLDPARFPYAAATPYQPKAHEIGTTAQFVRVCDTFNVQHALLVGPNSGYGSDNRCLLDAIAMNGDRFKGVGVCELDASLAHLKKLKEGGILGITLNATYHGVEHYLRAQSELKAMLVRLADLDLFLDVQVECDQILALLPLLQTSPVRLLFDHCGRPKSQDGLESAAFQALLKLGRTLGPSGRGVIKISGPGKFAQTPHPHLDAWPFVHALIEAFTLPACVWGSDWPFLRATERIDYGPLVALVQTIVPDAAQRRQLLWDNPRRIFGFR